MKSSLTIYKGEQAVYRNVRHAKHFLARLRGLLGRPPLKVGEGILLSPCGRIHTLGMRYRLDIIHLDKSGRVLKCVEGLKPNRYSASGKARHTLEVREGSIERNGIKVGDHLRWERKEHAK